MQDGNPNNLALFRFVSDFGSFASGALRRDRTVVGQLCLLDPKGQAAYIASIQASYGPDCLVKTKALKLAQSLGYRGKSEAAAIAHLDALGHEAMNAAGGV